MHLDMRTVRPVIQPGAVSVVRTTGGLVIGGECDATTAGLLARSLRQCEARADPLDLDLSDVTFADSAGLEPIADSVRRCRYRATTEPHIIAASTPVRRVLRALGVHAEPFDLIAWDAAGRSVVLNLGRARQH